MYICPICAINPGSHSFYKLKETIDNKSIFYTCPAKATRHDDYEGIVAHYEGMLNDNGNQPWIWIFDCRGFSLIHAEQVRISIAIAKLINKSESLKKIIITNATWHINTTLTIVQPFLSQRIKNLIHKSEIELLAK